MVEEDVGVASGSRLKVGEMVTVARKGQHYMWERVMEQRRLIVEVR